MSDICGGCLKHVVAEGGSVCATDNWGNTFICYRCQASHWADHAEKAEAERDALRAENERLRGALERLYKASFAILKKDPSEDEWGETNTACFEAGEALARISEGEK